MPLYEYKCLNKSCKNYKKFEQLHKSYEEKLTSCPECGGMLEYIISTTNFKFIGNGFYHNEYGIEKDKRNKENKPKNST